MTFLEYMKDLWAEEIDFVKAIKPYVMKPYVIILLLTVPLAYYVSRHARIPDNITLGETVLTVQLNGTCAPTWEALDQVEVAYRQGPHEFWNASVRTHSFDINTGTRVKVLDFTTGPDSGKAMVKVRILSVVSNPDIVYKHVGEECWVSYDDVIGKEN